ncbi:MAG: hypothetical protein IJW04_04825 [Ruminococcus sp.]|nr:hypothetical protein [Ruminococcus sp.]
MPIPKRKEGINTNPSTRPDLCDEDLDLSILDELDESNELSSIVNDTNKDDDGADVSTQTVTETNVSVNAEMEENKIDESVPEKSEPNEPQPVTKPQSSNNVYNFCGYRITSLTEKDAEIVRRYRFNEENISNYCLAKNTFFDYIQGNGEDFVFKKEWGFPYSGSYIGYIMNCSPSMKHCGEYYIAFLADNYDVCLFKFTTTFRDAVYNGVQRDLGLTSTIFRQADYSCLKGYLVLISVDNITLESGNVFSKITEFKIVDERMTEVIEKLIDDMSRQ